MRLISTFILLLTSTVAMANPAAAQNTSGQIAMLMVFVAIFYFLIWRPQSKRAKQHSQLIKNLSEGDEVVTTGGIIGKITKIADGFLTVEIAPNTSVKMQRQAVTSALPKGTLAAV